MSATISVVIAAYNAGPYIREAIDSALAQTRPPLEILVCDDASTDDTPDIVAAYGAPVRLIRSAVNQGQAVARNQAAAAAKGAYLAFIDADDIWKPNHLEVLAGLLDQHRTADFAFAQLAYYPAGAQGRLVLSQPYTTPSDVFLRAMRGDFGVIPSVTMIRRPLFTQLGGFRNSGRRHAGKRIQVEDDDFNIRASACTHVVGTPLQTVRYRIHPEQDSRKGNHGLYALAELQQRHMQELQAARDPRVEAATERVRMWWAQALERVWVRREMPCLRRMIWTGLRYPLYRPVTWRYVPRALFGRSQ